MHLTIAILAYIGPDQILPLGSVIASLIGVVLLGWRYLVVFFGRVFHWMFRR